MSLYFGRVYELTIGTGDGFVRTFDGFRTDENEPLQITFSIDQTPSSHRAYGEITVYGLNRKSRKQIYERFTEVSLAAGYRDFYANIFTGQIENVEIGRSGADTFVKLFCQTSVERWADADVFREFGANTPQLDIIRFVAESFGLPVDFIGDFSDLPRALKGKTVDKDAKYWLNEAGRDFGFTWIIEANGRLTITRDNASRPDSVTYRYTPATGLIGSPEITQQGVNIEVLMNPLIRTSDLYTVESETGQLSFNGVYYQRQTFPKTNGESTNRVISLRHEGDFYGDTWQTSIEGDRT